MENKLSRVVDAQSEERIRQNRFERINHSDDAIGTKMVSVLIWTFDVSAAREFHDQYARACHGSR
jgi:hypothetical protein